MSAIGGGEPVRIRAQDPGCRRGRRSV